MSVVDEITPEMQAFLERRDALVEQFTTDNNARDKALAEMYIFMTEFDAAIRTFMAQMENGGGPAGMLKAMMFGRKNKGGGENGEA